MKKINPKPLQIDADHPAILSSSAVMSAAVLIRALYYSFFYNDSFTPLTFAVYVILPILAGFLLVLSNTLKIKSAIALANTAVVLGVVFFALKAVLDFTPLHRNLCLLLYTAVLIFYTLSVNGVIPTKKLLYPLFSLPIIYHIFVEDLPTLLSEDCTIPLIDWLPEVTVILIMTSLLLQSVGFKEKE